jgi:serine/threonine protein kinase
MKLGRASDIWSLGCILYQMCYGRTPFAEYGFIQKLQSICDPNHKINFPPTQNPSICDVMKACLIRDPKDRIQIMGAHGLLAHPFLTQQRHSAPAASALTKDEKTNLIREVAAHTLKYAHVRKGDEEGIINAVMERYRFAGGAEDDANALVHVAPQKSSVSADALMGASSKLKKRELSTGGVVVKVGPSVDLKAALQSQGKNLKPLAHSSSAKWMKDKSEASPGKDLRSVLERGLNNLNFGDSTMQSNVGEDSTWTFGQ